MLKKMYYRKITVATLALSVLFILYLMPTSNNNISITKSSIEYVTEAKTEVVYLLGENNYLTRTTIKEESTAPIDIAKNVINSLIIDGEKSNIIQDGFEPLIPKNTKILNLSLENKILTINFSSAFLKMSKKHEEKIIESLVYSLTSIDGINQISLQVEGKNLEYLPITKKKLPPLLDKSYGINKTYDLLNTSNIESYTIYYVTNINDNKYYVPVTKYVNSTNSDKIKIIINELIASPIYETNLMSYLDANVSLTDYSLEEDQLKLNFNDKILKDKENHILEEVIYTISLSMNDNYHVKEVAFLVNNEEIYKKSLKTLE